MRHQQQHGGVCRDATPEEAETTVSKRICFAAQLDYDWTKPSMNFNYCVHPRWSWLRRGSLGDTKVGCGSTAQCGFWKTSLTLRLIYYTLTGGEFLNQNFNPRQKIIQFNLASDGLQRCAEKRLSLRTYSKNSGQHAMHFTALINVLYKFNPDQLGQLSLNEADRWRNTSEKQLKSSEALNKSTLFT